MKTKEQKRSVGKWTPSNILFNILNYAFLTFLTIICLYPMLHVLFASVSNPTELIAHQGLLLKPIGFTLSGYQLVFKMCIRDRDKAWPSRLRRFRTR